MGPYDLGAPVPASGLALQLTDASGNPAAGVSPAPVLTITLPDQTTATPAVTEVTGGTWEPAALWVSSQAGHHLWAWTYTGDYLPATQLVDSFEVREAPDPTIISLAGAKRMLRQEDTTASDSDIRSFSQAVTEWVEYKAGPVVTRQYTEIVRAQGRVLVLSKAPVRTDMGTTLATTNRRDGSTTNGLVSITPLLTYGFMYPLDDLLVDGPRGIVRHAAGLPFFYSGDPYSQFEAVYWTGRAAVASGIYIATEIVLKHVWAVERGGLTQRRPSFGESTEVIGGVGYAVPNRAIQLLTPHMGKASKAAFA